MPKATDAYTATDLGLLHRAARAWSPRTMTAPPRCWSPSTPRSMPILREAAPHLDDAALKTRIAEALAAPAPSLRISALTARSDAALKLLIDVHAAVEEAEAGGAGWAPAARRRDLALPRGARRGAFLQVGPLTEAPPPP